MFRAAAGLLALLAAASQPCLSAEPAFESPEATAPAWLDLNRVRAQSGESAQAGTVQVRWREFGPEAFAEAARAAKPVLLFITADWCRRGRMMERTTLCDAEVATHLNEKFIPVRLNRDERPDADVRMQEAVQALTGTRGWPLTVFLSPDGAVLSGGTYFPLNDDPVLDQFGMRSVLRQVSETWRTKQAEYLKQANGFAQRVREQNAPHALRGTLPENALTHAAGLLLARADLKAGGFAASGKSAQFPAPRALELLLARHARFKDPKSFEAAQAGLDALLRGAIYDQLGGGFHRYTSDRWWRKPHFEKLLSLNAEMLPALLHFWQATGSQQYRDALGQTLRGWSETGEPDSACFFGSQAAGDDGWDEGDYFTWTLREAESAIRDNAGCDFALAFYGLDEGGGLPWETGARKALYQALTPAAAMQRFHLTASEFSARLSRVRALLLSARLRRPAPVIDRNLYTDGNALMAAAFIECGRALDHAPYLARGLAALKELLRRGRSPAGTLHVLPNARRPAGAAGLTLDDAALLHACALAFEATQDAAFRAEADAALQRLQNARDPRSGAYFDRPRGAALELKAFDFPILAFQDTTEPSANALIALACVRLHGLTGDAAYAGEARGIVEAFASGLDKTGPYGASLVLAADGLQNGFTKITVIGPPGDAGTRAFLRAAHGGYAPWKLVTQTASLAQADARTAASAGKTPLPCAVVEIAGRFLTVSDPDLLAGLLRQ